MNIRQIEIFRAIVDAGSVTGAAQALSISQPSVSKHLKLLEHDLGFALFQRGGNSLVATPEGQALYDQVERVYTGIGFLEDFVEGLRNNQHGEVSIASMPLIAQRWLPENLAKFMADHQSVSFSLPVRSSNWISTAVAARRVHLGVGLTPSNPIPGLRVMPLMKLPVVCVMQTDSPLTVHDFVTAETLSGQGLVSLHSYDGKQLMIEEIAPGLRSGAKRSIETFSAPVACELVRQGAGPALIDAMTALMNSGERLTFKPFEPKKHLEICIMVSEHWALSRLACDIMELLIDRARSTEGKITDALQKGWAGTSIASP